jgi:hypothetical protein
VIAIDEKRPYDQHIDSPGGTCGNFYYCSLMCCLNIRSLLIFLEMEQIIKLEEEKGSFANYVTLQVGRSTTYCWIVDVEELSKPPSRLPFRLKMPLRSVFLINESTFI